MIKSCFPFNAFREYQYYIRIEEIIHIETNFYERDIKPFCPWSFYRVICVQAPGIRNSESMRN